MKPPTPYIEANAILYAQEGDNTRLAETLDSLLYGEMIALLQATERLRTAISFRLQIERERRAS